MPLYQTEDIDEQAKLLNEISQLVDEKVLQSTCTDVVSPINASNLRAVHARVESGSSIGKTVLADWA